MDLDGLFDLGDLLGGDGRRARAGRRRWYAPWRRHPAAPDATGRDDERARYRQQVSALAAEKNRGPNV